MQNSRDIAPRRQRTGAPGRLSEISVQSRLNQTRVKADQGRQDRLKYKRPVRCAQGGLSRQKDPNATSMC